jgi:hypothetical protein
MSIYVRFGILVTEIHVLNGICGSRVEPCYQTEPLPCLCEAGAVLLAWREKTPIKRRHKRPLSEGYLLETSVEL